MIVTRWFFLAKTRITYIDIGNICFSPPYTINTFPFRSSSVKLVSRVPGIDEEKKPWEQDCWLVYADRLRTFLQALVVQF